MISTHSTGQAGEERAAAFLISQGFAVLERGFRYGRYGEIDIIAAKDTTLIFVEVKNRKSDRFGGSRNAVSEKKLTRLRNTARHYLQTHPMAEKKYTLMRFDLIAFDEGELQWIEDILR